MRAHLFLAEEFHDIVPPVDYSILSPWVFITAVAASLAILCLFIWWLYQRRQQRSKPESSPRERALQQLKRMALEIESISPYQFSVRVSDILRRYVTEQYHLPVTRQTSIEFLGSLTKASP